MKVLDVFLPLKLVFKLAFLLFLNSSPFNKLFCLMYVVKKEARLT